MTQKRFCTILPLFYPLMISRGLRGALNAKVYKMIQPLLIEIGVEELPAVPLLKELKNIEKKCSVIQIHTAELFKIEEFDLYQTLTVYDKFASVTDKYYLVEKDKKIPAEISEKNIKKKYLNLTTSLQIIRH